MHHLFTSKSKVLHLKFCVCSNTETFSLTFSVSIEAVLALFAQTTVK